MNRETHNYLHIPKTGGTALKYVIDEHNKQEKTQPRIHMPNAGHNQKLARMNNACFIVRHPWDRFCSGFWERVTMPAREQLSKTKYKDVKGFGYKAYSSLEEDILDQCKTPNEFLTYIREGGQTQDCTPGLFELTASMCFWLGSLGEFQQNEHRVISAFHINNMNKAMKSIYDIEMPTDPFKKRSRDLFLIKQSYEISPQNRIWFEQEYRKQDYDLIAYIKTRPFFKKDF